MRHPTSNNDVRSNSYRFIKAARDAKESGDLDPEEAMAALHHCLGETEAFVFHLQRAIQAITVPKDKKNRRHKSDAASDLLPSLPAEMEVINAFKRIKLAINYVARLKSYLYDPNGPELIHVIFGYLEVLVDACKRLNPPYNSGIPPRIILPLLSRDAISLLRNCLVSKQMDLWKQMGKAWTLPRDEWKGEGSLCNAVLLEGWEAYYLPNGTVVTPQPRSTSTSGSRHNLRTNSTGSGGTIISDGSFSANTSRSQSRISPI
jgi:hypothetical protein